MTFFDHRRVRPAVGQFPASAPLSLVLGLKVAALTAQLLMLAFAIAGQIALDALLVMHLSLVLVLVAAAAIAERSGHDSSDLQKFALLSFTGGAIGAGSALVTETLRGRRQDRVLKRWYDTIAPPQDMAVTLVDRILDGRLVQREARLPKRFEHLVESGSIRQKQALLAFLASEDDHALASDVLKSALRSADQRVRVQAAAVASHIRNRARLTLLASAPGQPANDTHPPLDQAAG